MSIEGTWDIAFKSSAGTTTERWSVEGTHLRGTSEAGDTEAELTVDGDAFSFEVPVPNMPLKVTIAGQVDGDRISGAGKLAAMQVGTFEGTRSA